MSSATDTQSSLLTGTLRLRIPKGMPTTRYQAPKVLEVPRGTEVPLLDPELPEEKQVQEVWRANVRVFNLPGDTDALQEVWQMVTDGRAQVCENHTHFDSTTGKYSVFMRWALIEHALPGIEEQ